MTDVSGQVNVASLAAVTGPVLDNGQDPQVLQPNNQYPNPGAVVTTAPTSGGYGYTQAQAAALITTVNALLAACVAAGIIHS